ncbi:MAG: nucleoside deaminase [Synechococcales cyanobacterium]
MRPSHHDWMDLALAMARQAGSRGEIPVGAVIVDEHHQLLAAAGNQREQDHDPTAHAEMVALRLAGSRRQDWQLVGCRLYVTLEPCPMCAAAIGQARIVQVIYGVDDPKAGACGSVLNLLHGAASFHRPQILAGIREEECRQLVRQWFATLRGDPLPELN